MTNATLFLSDLFHQILFYIGGVLALVDLIATKLLHKPLEGRVFTYLGIGLLFVACFQAWIDEHSNSEQLIKEKSELVQQRNYWKALSDAKDQTIRETVAALSKTQTAFADLSNKVLDITRPEPLRLLVKQNEFASLSQNGKKVWMLSVVSNKTVTPVRGLVGCEHPFQTIGGVTILGEAEVMTGSGDNGVINDHQVRIGIVTPALNPEAPLLLLVLAADQPGLGKCTFTQQ